MWNPFVYKRENTDSLLVIGMASAAIMASVITMSLRTEKSLCKEESLIERKQGHLICHTIQT